MLSSIVRLQTRQLSYYKTAHNMLIGKHTKVICQGLTGNQGAFGSKEAIDFDRNMAGGVSPGKAGQTHLGLPVFGSVKESRQETEADASVINIPPSFAGKVILEAIDAEVLLVVAITERIPQHDVRAMKVLENQDSNYINKDMC